MTKSAPTSKPWRKTPLIESAALSRAAGCKVFLKLENLQPAASFKSRGIGNYLLARLRERGNDPSIHFYSSSGGNAGLACVTAAQDIGHPATVVVPMSTSAMMISKIRIAGATDVIQHGASWVDADRHLREEVLSRDPKGVYVPPFDHPDIWTGNSTIVDEIAADLPDADEGRPDAIICSVGGGGLFAGIMQGLDAHGWSSASKGTNDFTSASTSASNGSSNRTSSSAVSVLAVETHGAESLSAALNAGHLVTLPGITSIATGLGATRVAAKAFEYASRSTQVVSVVLSDGEAAMGSWRLADDERILVDPACGVSAAACYGGKRLREWLPHLNSQSVVVLVVCGGSYVTLETLAEYRRVYGPQVQKLAQAQTEVPSTISGPGA